MKPPVRLRYMLGIQDSVGAGIGNALREILPCKGGINQPVDDDMSHMNPFWAQLGDLEIRKGGNIAGKINSNTAKN